MIITMTWADGALAFVIGVIGSVLAAYLYNKLPALSNACSQWLARRSARATEARLQYLRLQLEQVKSFRNDTGKYVGWMLNTLSHVQMRFTFSIWCIVGAIGALVTASLQKNYDLLIAANVAFGGALGVFALGGIKRGSLMDLSNLERRETELKREIEKLETASGDKGD
jgi:hypothetical protein